MMDFAGLILFFVDGTDFTGDDKLCLASLRKIIREAIFFFLGIKTVSCRDEHFVHFRAPCRMRKVPGAKQGNALVSGP